MGTGKLSYQNISRGSILLLIIGLILFLANFAIIIPGNVKAFLGIPYATNPEFATSLTIKTSLMLTGIIFVSISLIYIIYETLSGRQKIKAPSTIREEKLSDKTVCIFCDAENPSGTFYCLKCGKRIRRK